MTPLAPASSPWAMLRFRRSKDVKGWAILGIPQSLYLLVMQPLFERQARFIDKYERGEFVNVLFEAPVPLAAQLALAFPAPPGCEPLVVNGGGDRILYGRAADSGRARRQRLEGEPCPALERLGEAEGFWNVVTVLAGDGQGTESVSGPRSSPETRPETGLEIRPAVSLGMRGQIETKLSQAGELPKAAGAAVAGGAIATPPAASPLPPGLDEEGFELDAWPEEESEAESAEAAAPEAEAFEDIWETEEADGDGAWALVEAGPGQGQSEPACPPARQPASEQINLPLDHAAPQQLAQGLSQPLEQLRDGGARSPQPRSLAAPQMASPSPPMVSAAGPISGPIAGPIAGPISGQPPHSAPQGALVPAPARAEAPGVSLAQLRSGLVPHASDAQILQGYASGGLTIAQAIAQMQQQEAQPSLPQRRRIELPFEHLARPPSTRPRPPAPRPPRLPGAAGPPAGPPGGPAPQLPSESWAAGAKTDRSQSSERWILPGEQDWPTPYPDSSLAGADSGAAELPAATCWPRPPGEPPPVDLSQRLSPSPTDIVCLPVADVHHLGILRRGVALWNAWRRDHPEIRPNLRSAYLNNLDLYGIDLHAVDLRDAFLFRADLRGADLSLASLGGADLIRADLGGACLWGACLGGAYLNYANLAQADLTQANMRGAFLQGAIFQGAIMPNGQDFEAWAAG